MPHPFVYDMNIESAKKINRPYFTITRCKADWSKKAEACKGDIECLKNVQNNCFSVVFAEL
jgi:hypothetical protein